MTNETTDTTDATDPASSEAPARSARTPGALVRAIVPHPQQRIAHERAMEVLTSPADHPFVIVVGPGGVGKSALLRTIDNALAWEERAAMEADPGYLPAIMVSTPAARRGAFSFTDLWMRVVEGAKAPAIDRVAGDSVVPLGPQVALNGVRGDRERDMRRLAARTVMGRRVRTILLDEANHLSVIAGSSQAVEQLDILKDFAAETGVRFLLAGAFPVLQFRDISLQMARRIRTVPFLPYDAAVKREREAFARTAGHMLDMIDGADGVLDDDRVDELIGGTAGCIGLLRDWLVAAEHHLGRARRTGSFPAALRETAFPRSTLVTARKEIDEGLTQLASDAPLRKTRTYVPPVTSGGQVLKPGEGRPLRRMMEPADDD